MHVKLSREVFCKSRWEKYQFVWMFLVSTVGTVGGAKWMLMKTSIYDESCAFISDDSRGHFSENIDGKSVP